jgi:hypothetical protein
VRSSSSGDATILYTYASTSVPRSWELTGAYGSPAVPRPKGRKVGGSAPGGSRGSARRGTTLTARTTTGLAARGPADGPSTTKIERDVAPPTRPLQCPCSVGRRSSAGRRRTRAVCRAEPTDAGTSVDTAPALYPASADTLKQRPGGAGACSNASSDRRGRFPRSHSASPLRPRR